MSFNYKCIAIISATSFLRYNIWFENLRIHFFEVFAAATQTKMTTAGSWKGYFDSMLLCVLNACNETFRVTFLPR